MTPFVALILGIVEGITEFLPISSTGHLILTGYFLKIQNSDATKAFEVVIQGAATLAVIWHYRIDLFQMLRGFFKKDPKARQDIWGLLLAFLPAAVIGLATHKYIKEFLFGPMPVVYAMLVGGLLILYIENKYEEGGDDFALKPHQALFIGFFQCLALWPGISRSMATIVGGRILGLSGKAAARFSFLLAIPTLLAASAYDLFKNWSQLTGDPSLYQNLAIGLFSAYVVSLLVIRGFLKFLGSRSLAIFGWYRIAFGVILFFVLG